MRAAWRGAAREVVVDPDARTTVGNMANALNDVLRVGAREVLVVTSSWHAPRAKAGASVAAPLDGDPGARGQRRRAARRGAALRELPAVGRCCRSSSGSRGARPGRSDTRHESRAILGEPPTCGVGANRLALALPTAGGSIDDMGRGAAAGRIRRDGAEIARPLADLVPAAAPLDPARLPHALESVVQRPLPLRPLPLPAVVLAVAALELDVRSRWGDSTPI